MKIKARSILALRPLLLTGAALLLLAALPTRAHAAFVLTLSQSGGNVLVNGSGSLDISTLTSNASGAVPGEIIPAAGILIGGPPASGQTSLYGPISGPGSFGTGGSTSASSGSGSYVGVFGGGPTLIIPDGYQSGTQLTTSSVYSGATFASLGFTPGTYTYTWGTGANADSFIVTSGVPEPSTWALFGVGVAGLGVVTLRQRRRAVRA